MKYNFKRKNNKVKRLILQKLIYTRRYILEKLDYLIEYLLKDNKNIKIDEVPMNKEAKKDCIVACVILENLNQQKKNI